MPPKPSHSAKLPPSRGRAPAPWTIWELMAIAVSVLMIVVPLSLEVLNWLRPPVVPAQGLMAVTETAVSLEQRPPTFTPVNSPTPGTPTAVTPTVETPTAVTPTVETPTAATPTVETPTAATPTVETPTAATPTVETPTAVTPTVETPTSLPTLTPSPTPGTTRVTKFASLSTAAPGQPFSYSLAVTTQSDSTLILTLRDVLAPELEVLDVSAVGGSCFLGQTVLCTLNVSSLNPASVTIQVRVLSSVSEGTVIPNQARLEQGSLQIGVSNVVNVTVAGSAQPTPEPTTATATPTPTATPTVPTTPTLVTAIPPTVVVTNTPLPATPRPTSPPRPPAPPEPTPTASPVPPPPTASPPVLPTEPPTSAPVVTVAPRPTATPRPRPPAPPTNTPTPEVSPTPTEPPAPAVFGESDLLLRLSSDWGSVYAGQDVVFTVILGNTHPSQTISAVSVRSVMPANLQVLNANASRGADPVINGRIVTYVAPDLAPGERVELTIATRVQPNVAVGTLLVVQAQANYSGLSRPVFSNISTVLVVGSQQVATAIPTLSPTIGRTPVVTSSPAVTATVTVTASVTVTPMTGGKVTATATPVPPAAGGQSGSQAPLPNTSAGIPFLGVLLLGATLLTRTIRLHRARERI
ncbi:hypothetical protein [Chloroflexus aggregans]|uniref:Uncharacterized protein n=1 Tax=Chloroflexus aggregans (strain MD-66 / DSM 9485) TaxID=326427 RepID=B8G7D5_CHLAD|nr:hypothetical protein [Chloroflexus aggregans]ACL25970.1 conserved hypothetical protein [Chloroflexus aggregans DSM 9485]